MYFSSSISLVAAPSAGRLSTNPASLLVTNSFLCELTLGGRLTLLQDTSEDAPQSAPQKTDVRNGTELTSLALDLLALESSESHVRITSSKDNDSLCVVFMPIRKIILS